MAESETALRVVVIDDDDLLRTALTQLLDLQPGISVVGQAADGVAAVELIRSSVPDVALVDLEMPGCDGISVAQQVRDVVTKVVVVTRHARPTNLQRALQAGATGFILKSTSSQRLVEILNFVAAGQRYVDPEIAGLALTMRPCPLTDREREVLALVHQGLRGDEIAARLHLAPGTVRNYLSSASARLQATSSRAAAELAYSEGWI